ncbi:hypothetical protein K438DRAFT_956426 [Mycena galopus ATCC 62051]|nr:hypothetical protein K438DRAFT_956426 [Mycena galopus ATCC 62051]
MCRRARRRCRRYLAHPKSVDPNRLGESPTPSAPTSSAPTSPRVGFPTARLRRQEQRAVEKAREKELKQAQKQRTKAEKAAKDKPGHHFIVLPTGLGQVLGGGEKWEKVVIGGVSRRTVGCSYGGRIWTTSG